MRYILKHLMGALALAATSIVNASTWVRCDTCDINNAAGYSAASGYLGAVVVYNLPARKAFKFFNSMEMVGDECHPNSNEPGESKNQVNRSVGCHSQVVAIPEEANQDELRLKDALVDFYQVTEGTLQAKIEFESQAIFPGPGPVTGENGGSAYDFENNIAFRGQVSNAARAASNTAQLIASWNNLTDIVSTAVSVTLLGMDGSALKVKILYPDGSQTIIIFDKDMDIVSRNSVSAEGLDIVSASNLNQMIGQLNFNNEQSLQNFFDTLNFLNVPVSSTYYQMPLTGSCRPIPNGVSCTRPR